MKKNNIYLVDDDLNFGDLLRILWNEKILISSISIICGLVGYLFAFFQPEELKVEIKLKNPPAELFETYNYFNYLGNSKASYKCHFFNTTNNTTNNITTDNITTDNITYGGCLTIKFFYDFKSNFLSLDNLESFAEESKGLDNFNKYLKSKNITFKQYYIDSKIGEVKQKNIIIPNNYFLVFNKNLDGDIFLNNYVEFIKKKTILELKKSLKLNIQKYIIDHEIALEKAKSINLEKPILLFSQTGNQVVEEPVNLFYQGSTVLSQTIINLKKLVIQLENDQFAYNIILDKASHPKTISKSNIYFMFYGFFFGIFCSILIIFFRSVIQKKS